MNLPTLRPSLLALLLSLSLLLSTAAAQQAGPKDALAGAKWSSTADSARVTFTLDDPPPGSGAWLVLGPTLAKAKLTLNGKVVAGPLAGMTYGAVPLDPKEYLIKGENVFAASEIIPDRKAPPTPPGPPARLEIYPAGLLAIQSGPVLGAIGPDYFTVACRTNLPAAVEVAATPIEPAAKEITAASPRGWLHRFHLNLPPGTKKFAYTVTCRSGEVTKTEGPFTVRVPGGQGKPLRIVLAGDCRSDPEKWTQVVAAILKAQPELVLFTGDFVSDGRLDELWDPEFFTPARELLRTVPLYGVLGNHDHNAPLYYQMFYTASPEGKGDHWVQAVGDMLLVGVDGGKDWSAGSKNAQWLDEVLGKSKEKFIILATHYPAWSSGPHGRGEVTSYRARDVIMPILAKHRATAMVAGHDHLYERSEPPTEKGVPCIVAGGAGAPLARKSGRGAANNPYSKVLTSALHYCVLELTGEKCDMKVYGLDGKLIDHKSFAPRQ